MLRIFICLSALYFVYVLSAASHDINGRIKTDATQQTKFTPIVTDPINEKTTSTLSIQNTTASSIPSSTTLATQTTTFNISLSTTIATQTNSTLPLKDIVEMYVYLGVGIIAAILLPFLMCVTFVIVFCIHFFNRKKQQHSIKSYEFPWGNCQIYGIQQTPENTPEHDLFKKVIVDNKVIYVRNSEGMQQYPDKLANPVYEIVDDNFKEFKLCENSSGKASSSLASTNLSEVTAIENNNSLLYEVIT
ncbi:hypothetical protein LOD99_1313 [Oopsacas minuta]|uniref:Uncharacterized protein n=1 Tax=Oopsacas minuta TaxID=111878 RepID=A0AAV7K5F9_9METZ|nr:hypothetical protein LOD99_1313 [Oopsacas minuta]